MTDAVLNATVEQAAAREKLERHWLGRCRYFQTIGNDRVQVPEYMFTEWYTPEGVHREVCVGLTPEGKPKWMPKPDGPPPRGTFSNMTADKSEWEKNPAADMPNFDYVPPAYDSDTHSGGPANFDGNAGGDNNPRNPALEGEVPNHYAEQLAEYQARLADMEAKYEALSTAKVAPAKKKTASKKTASKGVDGLKDLINGNPE